MKIFTVNQINIFVFIEHVYNFTCTDVQSEYA